MWSEKNYQSQYDEHKDDSDVVSYEEFTMGAQKRFRIPYESESVGAPYCKKSKVHDSGDNIVDDDDNPIRVKKSKKKGSSVGKYTDR